MFQLPEIKKYSTVFILLLYEIGLYWKYGEDSLRFLAKKQIDLSCAYILQNPNALQMSLHCDLLCKSSRSKVRTTHWGVAIDMKH